LLQTTVSEIQGLALLAAAKKTVASMAGTPTELVTTIILAFRVDNKKLVLINGAIVFFDFIDQKKL
jgi:hypothetical protein